MKLHNITNLNSLFCLLDQADGNITFQTADGYSYDWRTEKNVLRSVASNLSVPGLRELTIHCERAEDTERVLSYLMECRPQQYAS